MFRVNICCKKVEKFEILEIQGTAEGKPFPKEHLDQLFELGKECIKEVFEIQK